MFDTPFGKLNLSIDNISLSLVSDSLPLKCKRFQVDERRMFTVSIPKQEKAVVVKAELELLDNSVFVGQESGENLALMSFWNKELKLSLGTEGDITGIKYQYLNNGLKLTVLPTCMTSRIRFVVTWRRITNYELEKNDTWFAADPNLKEI